MHYNFISIGKITMNKILYLTNKLDASSSSFLLRCTMLLYSDVISMCIEIKSQAI